MIRATYNSNGDITGHYDDSIHAVIPEGAIEITEAEWIASCNGNLWIDCVTMEKVIRPDRPTPKHIWKDREWIPDRQAIAATKLADLAAYRWGKEVGGLTLANGMKIATDDRSKGLIAGSRVDTMTDSAILTDWKSDSGWIKIDADTVAIISTAVAAHVRGCFSVERTHAETIAAMSADPTKTADDIAAYDITTGWPQ